MPNNQANTKRIAKNTVFMFFRMFLVMAVGLYTSRVVLATLGVDDYGLYNVVGGVVVLFGFLQQALNNATYRYLAFGLGSGDESALCNTFSMAINAHLILAGFIILLAETVGLWILNNKLSIPAERLGVANFAYQMSVACCCINIVKTPYNSSIIAHEKMGFYAYTSIVEVVLKLLIVYLLVIGDFDKLKLYSVLTLGVAVFMLLWYYLHCKKSFTECKYKLYWDGSLITNMVKYSGLSIIVNLVDVCVTQSIVFFFNVFYGLAANAALAVANQVNGQLGSFLSSFSQAYNPQIIKSYAAGNKDYFFKLIFSASKISYYLLFLAAIPVLMNIDFILNLWLVNPPEGTGVFFSLIICYSLIDAYSAPLWIGVHATGNLRTHQILMASIKILNIPLAYVMLKNGLPAWTALALKAGLNLVCSIVRPCYVKKLYALPLNAYFRDVFVSVYLSSAIILPLPLYVESQMNDGLTKLAMTSLIFFITAGPIIFFVGLKKNEQNIVLNFILSKISKAKLRNML